jgi:hypothetical protein
MKRKKSEKIVDASQAAEPAGASAQESTPTELQSAEESRTAVEPFPAGVHERFGLPPDQFCDSQDHFSSAAKAAIWRVLSHLFLLLLQDTTSRPTPGITRRDEPQLRPSLAHES